MRTHPAGTQAASQSLSCRSCAKVKAFTSGKPEGRVRAHRSWCYVGAFEKCERKRRYDACNELLRVSLQFLTEEKKIVSDLLSAA